MNLIKNIIFNIHQQWIPNTPSILENADIRQPPSQTLPVFTVTDLNNLNYYNEVQLQKNSIQYQEINIIQEYQQLQLFVTNEGTLRRRRFFVKRDQMNVLSVSK